MNVAENLPTVDIDEAFTFLETLDDTATRWTFQTFDDTKQKRKHLAKVMHGTLDECRDTLIQLNQNGAGVYVTVNETDFKGRTANNVQRVRAVFTDLDGAPIEPVNKHPLERHMVVNSSHGRFHSYWFVDENFPLDQFERVQKALAKKFNGDPVVHDLPRVMRLPGFYNMKNPQAPFLTTINDISPIIKPYTFEQIITGFQIKDDPPEQPRLEQTGNYYADVNASAMQSLFKWVPALFPEAKPYHDGFRISSKSLGRDLEEDLSILPEGIKDFGVHDQGDPKDGKRSPIDLVIEWGPATNAAGAAQWLCQKMGIQPGKNRANGTQPKHSKNKLPKQTTIEIIRASDVPPQSVEWLWPDRIAIGKITIIAGDPGLGKSMITAAFASTVSNGGLWPVCRTQAPLGSVLMVSAEDDLADTIRPRLDAAGADVTRVHLLKSVVDTDEETGKAEHRMLSLKKDLEALDQLLPTILDCKLVIIDPISAYLDGTDSHNNADVRAFLTPLADLASRHRIALVVVTHLNKGGGQSAMYRAMGSLAFVAAARAAFAVTRDENDNARRLVLPIKNNLGNDETGLAYQIDQDDKGVPYILWESDPVVMSADDVLGCNSDEKNSALDSAVEWLEETLKDGLVDATDIEEGAKQAAITKATLRRAKDKLGVKSKKHHYKKGWYWILPKHDVPEDVESNVVEDDQDPC